MTNLGLRTNYFENLYDIRRDFDRMFNRLLSGKPWTPATLPAETEFTFEPAIETFVDKDGTKFFCRVSLPAVDPKAVHIYAQGNTLTISGKREGFSTSKDVDFLQEEFAYGSFERTLTLPEGVNADKLYAEYKLGVLEISAPISQAALPRRIEIKNVPVLKETVA
jgi:HSP20 family protein